jgi:HAD superfamily hydrolase (TIGR01509 family)
VTEVFDPGRVRAVLFDIDGTLADTDAEYVRRLAGYLRPLQTVWRKLDTQSTARRMVMAAETPTNAFLGFVDRLSLDEILEPVLGTLHRLRGEAKPQNFQLIPGVRATLEALADQYPLAIVTAREQRSAKTILRTCELEGFFECVATARTCRRTKPHPSPVLWAAAQLGVAPHACLMVGDTTVDIRAGVAAGTQTVGVLCGFGERHELERAKANLILESTTELADVLLSI